MSKISKKRGELEEPNLIQDLESVKQILEKHSLTVDELKQIMARGEPMQVPISIFRNKVGPMAALCIYLKDYRHLKLSQIARLINRDARSVWAAYSNSKPKSRPMKEDLRLTCSIEVFKNRERSVMENLVFHLKTVNNLTLTEIANLLGRSNKTIWCFYNRALAKDEK